MQHLSSLLSKVLKQKGLKDETDASHIVHMAQMWLLDHGHDDVAAARFTECSIVLSVQSSIAAQECHSHSEDLLIYLKKTFPSITIEKVRIVRA